MSDLAMPSASIAGSAEWARCWRVVLASAAGVALSTTHIYSLGVLIGPLEAEFGWSRAQISSGMTIGSVIAILSSPFMGMLVDRIGPRRVALCGSSLFCVALAMLSLANPSIWSWLALWVVLGFGINGITPMVWSSGVSGLFVRTRGLALSVTLCGTGVGSAFTPLVTSYLSTHYGWRVAYVGLGAFWALIVLPLVALFFTSPKDRLRMDMRVGDAAVEPVLSGLSAREGLRSSSFFKLSLAAFALTLVTVSFMVNLVPILGSTGLSRMHAAEIASIAGVTSIVGRLCGGYLLDRINGNLVAAVSALLPVIPGCLLLAMPGHAAVSTVAAAVLGLALGAELDAVAYLATRHFGMRRFGVLFGAIGGLLSLATGTGPLLVSYIFDVTKSYESVLWAYLPLCALSAILFWSLGRYPEFPDSADVVNGAR